MADRQFLVDINPNMELPKYELILYRLMGLPITSLKNITNFNYKAFFIGIDEISFNIPAYRNENDGQKVKNEIYDLVDGEYYILLNDKKYFIIDEINERADDDGNTYKEVHAYSREYELSQKKLVDYKADSRILYDSSNTMIDGLEKGVLNYIFNHITKSWSIGDVDADIILKDVHRALDFPNTNLIQVFQELQKTFNCIFKFDTINQKIDIVEMDTTKIGQNQGLYISNGNFIKSLSKNIKYDEVKTRLFVYGKDNVSIQSISPTGQPFLDNFDAFKNTKSMTQCLIDALDAYQTKVENYNPDFEPLLAQLQQANQTMEDLINSDHPSDLNLKGLIALERALSIVQTQIDVKVEELAIIRRSIEGATGTDLENMYADMRSIQSAIEGYENEKLNIKTLITNKQTEIDNQQIVIDGIKQQISDLQYVLDMNNPLNFTTEQLEELDKFIRVETYNDTNYTEHNITELYEEGKKMLARISQPQIQFDVDVVDFLSVVECQHIWKKFVLGDIVTLEHRELGFDYEVRLVGYEHDYENNRLNLKFSNTYTFDDDTLWMRDLLEEINTTATAVDFNKHKWDKADDMQSNIAKLVDAKLEEARQNILSAVGQGYLFDDSGLWLYKENPDGSINPEQIRAINNTIALTKDNFNTVSTAITPDGIVAEQIYGKLGKFARVNAEQIEVGGWDGDLVEDNLKEYIDQQNSELNDSVEGLGGTINNAFSDNYITNIEANSLDLARNSVVKEANDVKNIATSLGVSTTTITTAINNLNTEVNKYVGKTSYPISITPTNRTNMTNAFTSLESAIAQLYKAIDEKRISNANTSLTNYIDNINDNLTGLIDGKVDTWFYAVDPTLSNPPASAWTTSAIRDKHIGDLYFNTTSGYTFRFKKVGTVYSWERIKDKDIVDAMTKASNAQDTADGKRTIFTSQPTPPYSVGDLWRVTDVEGVDFKICITARATGSFLASHWVNVDKAKGYIDSQVDELNDSVEGLGGTINNAFSDNYITNIEANSLDLARNSVVKEAEDVKNIATSLSVSTTVITNAINNLNTEVNKYVGKPSYPIEITPINRTSLLNAFAILEGAIVALYQTIDEKRIQSVTVHQIILSNENQSIVTDSNGVVSTLTEVQSDIDVFRGITKVSATIGTPILKNKNGNTITFGTITKSNPTSVSSGNVKWSIPNNTNISSESGWIEIPITVEEIEYIKRLTWNKARAGQKGEDGIPAKIVTVAPSHPYFIKNKEGATPDNITLTPNFQNCIYSKWEYNKNDEGWIDILKTTPSTSEPWIDNSTKTLTIPKQFNLYKKLIDVPPFRYIRSSQKGGWFTAIPRYRVWGEIKAFVNGVNIAKNKSVTSSIAALSSNPLINLVDDNTTTFTIINNTILTTWEWVKIDLGSIRNDVDSILHYTTYVSGEDFAAPIKLEVSPDNVNWFTIYDSDTSGTYVEPEGGKMFNLIENIDGISYRISSTTGEQDVQTIANLYDSSELAEDMKNTLKQNFYYNRTKITEQEGIEVYDNLGNRVLQMGGFDSTGKNGAKDMYGFIAPHTDGTYSAVVRSGLIKKYPDGDATYLNNLYVVPVVTADPSLVTDTKPSTKTIYLPMRFKGQNPEIIPVVKSFVLWWAPTDGGVSIRSFTWEPVVTITRYLNAEIPYLKIDGWIEAKWSTTGIVQRAYSGLEVVLLMMMA